MTRSSRAWACALLSGLLFTSVAVAENVATFELYPTAAQPCLNTAQTQAKCDSSTVPKFNGCVCSNGNGFIEKAVQCLSSKASDTLGTVYNTMSTNCKDSSTPIPFNLQQFLALGSGGQTTGATTTATSTKVTTITSAGTTVRSTLISTVTGASSPTAIVSVVTLPPVGTQKSAIVTTVTFSPVNANPSSASSSDAASTRDSDSGGSKLGAGAIAGIAVGGAAVIALLGVIALLLRRSHQKKKDAAAAATTNTTPGPFGGAPSPAMSAVPPYGAPNPHDPHAPDAATAAKYNSGWGPSAYAKTDGTGYSPVPQYAEPYGQNTTAYNPHAQQTAYGGAGAYAPQQGYAPPHPQGQQGPVELGGNAVPQRPAELPS